MKVTSVMDLYRPGKKEYLVVMVRESRSASHGAPPMWSRLYDIEVVRWNPQSD